MHMADALVSPAVGLTMTAVSVGAMAYSISKIKADNEFDEKKIPMMGVMGAFVFAGQMINFTIPGTGSSGHIGGGILLAALLGKYPSFLSLVAVLMIQCLFFADGGLLALGCNIFNMGIIPCLIIYPLLFKPLLKNEINPVRLTVASILSVVIGLQLGAFSVVLQTVASEITELPFSTFVLLMQPIHLAIGLVEGIVTATVLNYVYSARPEIVRAPIEEKAVGNISVKKVMGTILALAFILGCGISLYASAFPDGLEWSMEKVAGTAELSTNGKIFNLISSIQNHMAFMPDYAFKHTDSAVGTSVAGFLGCGLTIAVACLTGVIIYHVKQRNRRKADI